MSYRDFLIAYCLVNAAFADADTPQLSVKAVPLSELNEKNNTILAEQLVLTEGVKLPVNDDPSNVPDIDPPLPDEVVYTPVTPTLSLRPVIPLPATPSAWANVMVMFIGALLTALVKDPFQ
jgi:hypothetical protein